MGEAKRKQQRQKSDEKRRLDEGLKETFPASDPLAETEPGGGITGDEPPRKGQKTGR
ncbi:MAG TPA: hypothetical protein PKA55_09700 [Rhodoblastus sp.]|nr:hypothetical protein [Rhodoblastus sp.]